MIRINESMDKVVKITISDPDNQIIQLLEYIKDLSLSGHTFDVVVDPDLSENKRSFWIDGDGCCRINSISKIDDVTENASLPLQFKVVDDDRSSLVTPLGIKSNN